jgi:hypothetical protein
VSDVEQMGITVLQQLAGGGVFAILFGFMLWYVLNQNDKREIRYQNTIDKNQEVIGKLADKLDVIKDVQEDVEEAKKDIQYIKAKMG